MKMRIVIAKEAFNSYIKLELIEFHIKKLYRYLFIFMVSYFLIERFYT